MEMTERFWTLFFKGSHTVKEEQELYDLMRRRENGALR